MHLSCLLINVGDNPDRADWRTRNWLRNRYRVHQRLSMAFPSAARRTADAKFLTPYVPEDFPEQAQADQIMRGNADVHEERDDQGGFLYRIDFGVPPPPNAGRQSAHSCAEAEVRRPVILVQSAKPPDWNYAFGLDKDVRDPVTGRPVGNAGYLLAAAPEVKELKLGFQAGDILRFRLNANPTRKVTRGPFSGKRVSVGRGHIAVLDWLWRKASEGGWEPIFERTDNDWDPNWRIETGLVHAWKKEDAEADRMSFACANIDGLLKVSDPERFRETITRGIGPAKSFGFGLLSVRQSNNARLPRECQ